jgi:hypothetical protein
MLTREAFDLLGMELMSADEASDPVSLAEIGWHLYAVLGADVAEIEHLRAALRVRVISDGRTQPHRHQGR